MCYSRPLSCRCPPLSPGMSNHWYHHTRMRCTVGKGMSPAGFHSGYWGRIDCGNYRGGCSRTRRLRIARVQGIYQGLLRPRQTEECQLANVLQICRLMSTHLRNIYLLRTQALLTMKNCLLCQPAYSPRGNLSSLPGSASIP